MSQNQNRIPKNSMDAPAHFPEDIAPLPVVPPYHALHENKTSPCMSSHFKHFLTCLRATNIISSVYEGQKRPSCTKYWNRFVRCVQAKNGDNDAKLWLLKQEVGMIDLRENDTWNYKQNYVNALRRSGRLVKGGAEGVEDKI